MKEAADLVQKNIENLSSLWRTVGEKFHSHTSGPDFDYSVISSSEWPNRLWFHHDIQEKSLEEVKNVLRTMPTRLVIPYWDIYQSHAYELLEANGFEKLFEQVGMSLNLAQAYKEAEGLHVEKVSSEEGALLWESLFKEAFGYNINHTLLLPNDDNISFLLAFYHQKPVGTAILHQTPGAVVGIHAMGIIPEMRRKGFAEQTMHHILNQSIEQGYKYATLQASLMGKGLYLKLGFEEQFIMKNYVLASP